MITLQITSHSVLRRVPFAHVVLGAVFCLALVGSSSFTWADDHHPGDRGHDEGRRVHRHHEFHPYPVVEPYYQPAVPVYAPPVIYATPPVYEAPGVNFIIPLRIGH